MSILVDGVDQSGDLGAGVNFNGSLDTGSAWAWFKVMVLSDARVFNKSDGFANGDQTIKIGEQYPFRCRTSEHIDLMAQCNVSN